MKNIFILLIILNSFLLAVDAKQETKMDKEIQKQIELEKKYAREQTFYKGEDFDLKSFEINPDSIKSIPDSNIDYSDGDDVLEMD
ncbi:hypothetical protein [Sulfurimonas sp.]|uniref:hypothetical protein n=1 Tax=Sulfurimonas sp. TaxID=2022749 RepID=UPI002B480117|nr:hypothetical protein [Sulfurimonas sp.]